MRSVSRDAVTDPLGPVPQPLIELVDVSFTYPGAVPVEALQPVTLTIGRGEQVAVVGPSGSGKSTFLQVLGLLARPTSGTYRIDGRDVGGMSEDELCDVRGTTIGFVFQAFHLIAHRDVAANVELPLRYSPIPYTDDQRGDLVSDALDRVGLTHRIHHRCNQLSGGESQRVAIARAMVTGPALILADEPTGNLDSTNSAQIVDLLLRANASGSTLVVITHDAEVADRFDRRLVIHDGVVSGDLASPRVTTGLGGVGATRTIHSVTRPSAEEK